MSRLRRSFAALAVLLFVLVGSAVPAVAHTGFTPAQAAPGSVITLDGARDNWFGPWPPPSLIEDEGTVPTEARRGEA